MDALGIIFCDHYSVNTSKNDLTRARTPASLPYAGRYRTIDFSLSSMVNAAITDVALLCKENYGALLDHLGSGEDWDLNRRKGGLILMTPMARPENHRLAARGRLDALRAIKRYIENSKHEYVVMAFGGTVANIDLDAMLSAHQEKNAYLTIAYSTIPAGIGEMILNPGEDGRILSVSYQRQETPEPANFALGTGIMKRSDLLAFLDEAEDHDYTNLNRQLIADHLNTHRILGYHHSGYARIIHTIEDYFTANMDMLNTELRCDLFSEDRPVFTKVKDSVPSLYDYHAIVSNSLIADGCVIKGTVKNCILSRGVIVEEGAVVEDAILMQNSVVRKNANVKRIIADKNVTIREGTELQGAPLLPFVLGKGKQV